MRQKHATCDKIALCKWAYLCDMRLLHAVVHCSTPWVEIVFAQLLGTSSYLT